MPSLGLIALKGFAASEETVCVLHTIAIVESDEACV